MSTDPSGTIQSLADLAATIPTITWLWPGWIPRGMITLLCAAAGAGKSYLALDLAHRLIAGLPWPDGAPAREPSANINGNADVNVIYVDAEDAPQLLNERALAWGIDRSHLFPLLAGSAAPLDLNAQPTQQRLLAMAAALRPALVIVDSLGSAARGAENQVAVVDALFCFLNRVALQHQCGLLLIHHLRKRSAAHAPIAGDDVRGSGHIVSLARSVLGMRTVQIGLDPEQDDPRRLQLLKTNLGPHPAPLGVDFVPSADGSVRLSYRPPPEDNRPRTQVESCARWLLAYLAERGAPQGPNFLRVSAHMAGFSRATLFRARDLVGPQIIDTLGRHRPGNEWKLAEPPPAPELPTAPTAPAPPSAAPAPPEAAPPPPAQKPHKRKNNGV